MIMREVEKLMVGRKGYSGESENGDGGGSWG